MPDRGKELESWLWLTSDQGAELRSLTQGLTHPTPAQVVALRKRFSEAQVHAALQLVAGQGKALAKFGPAGGTMLADPEGVEMATGPASGAWKATRIARVAGVASAGVHARMVGDVCCGIGGDAIAMKALGIAVRAVDNDPLRAWMAATNTGTQAGLVDLRDADAIEKLRALGIKLVHIDPARRTGAGRVWRVEDLQPGPEAIARVMGGFDGAGVKLAPGVDFGALQQLGIGASSEIEIISERGKLTQAMVWVGDFASPQAERVERRATLLTKDASVTLAGQADAQPPMARLASGSVGRYMYEVDDAIERAEVLTLACERSGMGMAHPGLGLLTGDEGPGVIGTRWTDARHWLRAFEVLDAMVWNERKVSQRLKQLRAGIVEVKTRDKVVSPDALQVQWSGDGEVGLVVFVLRFGSSLRAMICKRAAFGE